MSRKTSLSIKFQRYILTALLLITVLYSSNAQTLTLSGKIQDSIGKPLAFANIIAQSEIEESFNHAISDEEGRYRLILRKEVNYAITITYLGYRPKKISFKKNKNHVQNFMLIPNTEELEQVTLNYTPPIVIKKDTIAYSVSSFVSGKERKLRDVLKKLPGVEVDKDGNVLVRGKKVTKVLVEGKLFFTGNSKLAVNNIPANAVETVVVLDNYSDVAFLKGLEDSDEMAMNIELKEDKKKFLFGEIETATGITNRYTIHPTLYYYSPKTTVNFIGDLNNIGEKSFTLKDYLDFEGGVSRLLTDSQSYFSLYTNDFARFLRNRDYTESKQQFGAFNLDKELNDNFSFSSYGIFSNSKTETQESLQNQYIGNDNLNELRERNSQNTITFGIAKASLSYVPNEDTEFSSESLLKLSDNNQNGNTQTTSTARNAIINTKYTNINSAFKEQLQWHKRFNKKNVSSILINYQYEQSTPQFNWNTNQTLLTGLIPIVNEDLIDIYNDKSTQSQSIQSIIKHYKILSANHHLYVSLGNNFTHDHYNTFEYQRLEDESINNFTSNGFNNRTRLTFNDFFSGIEYKFKKNIFTIKTGLIYHNYAWKIDQFEEENSRNKNIFLPELTANVDFSNSKKLVLKYRKKIRFPTISQLANRLTLLDFNSVYRGNNTLENQRFHDINLNFYRFSMYRDILYTISVNFRKSDRNIKNATQIQGIDYISTPFLLENEDLFWQFGGSLRKGFKAIKLSLKSNVSLSTYFRPINNELIKASSNNYAFKFDAETKFKNFPNLQLGIDKRFSEYNSITNTSFENTIISGTVDVNFLKNFTFNIDYQHERYVNKTMNQSNDFNIGNTALSYQKNESPWNFEFSVSNMFNVEFKRRNTFSTLLVSDQQIFIFPRIFMFKVIYTL
ncbi:carboxypeptidase-like regulatory domain-containing protein [Kordia sp.]|uniref:carboxypeptidase-like regulatory domain-containing protein n=1 Tax=Kordia sp. TaxID=1965332 RepID=UPI003D2A521D